MGASNCFLPRAPSNLVTPLVVWFSKTKYNRSWNISLFKVLSYQTIANMLNSCITKTAISFTSLHKLMKSNLSARLPYCMMQLKAVLSISAEISWRENMKRNCDHKQCFFPAETNELAFRFWNIEVLTKNTVSDAHYTVVTRNLTVLTMLLMKSINFFILGSENGELNVRQFTTSVYPLRYNFFSLAEVDECFG